MVIELETCDRRVVPDQVGNHVAQERHHLAVPQVQVGVAVVEVVVATRARVMT